MKRNKGYTAFELLVCLVILIGAYGWIVNILHIVDTVDGEVTGMFVLRCVGVVLLPLGAILGFC